MKELGLGNRPNAAQALESDEEDELFESVAFGSNNPDSFLSALWYMNTVHCGLRGTHEHRQIKWGDIKLFTETGVRQKLIYKERLTKTRDGTNTKIQGPMHQLLGRTQTMKLNVMFLFI